MLQEEIRMNHQDLKRLNIIEKVNEKRMPQKEAASFLGCSTRTIKRWLSRYRRDGAIGLIHKGRGKTSNRLFSADHKQEILHLIFKKYKDFGPAFAAFSLGSRDNIKISKETLRQWMIEENIWHSKSLKKQKTHPLQDRRHHYGSLIQIDGSPHDWFEGRSAPCTLIVFIDDATSKIQFMRFFPTETTFAYFEVLNEYIERYGMPQELYSDKHGIFRVNHVEPESGTGLTQFGRCVQDLGIALLYANSPQAKGRVERRNRVLQDHLIKDMRLDEINTMEMANGAYLDNRAEIYNARFAVAPFKAEDAHIKLIEKPKDYELNFTLQESRKISKDLMVSYKNKKYVIKKPEKARRLSQAKVTICEAKSGKITILYKEQSLDYQVYNKKQYYSEVVSRKELGPVSLKLRTHPKPAADHPWKRSFKSHSD